MHHIWAVLIAALAILIGTLVNSYVGFSRFFAPATTTAATPAS